MVFKILLVGALGGISPTLLRIAIDLVSQARTIKDLNASILLGMALFGLLGSIVAGLWGEKDLKRVFYLGLGLPSLLTVGTSHSTASVQKGNSSGSVSIFWGRVFAAEVPIAGRRLATALPQELDGAQAAAVFQTQSGEVVSPVPNNGTLTVPPSASTVIIRSSLGSSEPVNLPQTPNVVISLSVKAEKNIWYGFKYAIGINSPPYNLTVSSVSIQNSVITVAAQRPIALAYLPAIGPLILQDDGKVSVIEGGRLKPYFQISRTYTPIDLTATMFAGLPRSFVSAVAGVTSLSSIVSFSDDHVSVQPVSLLPNAGGLSGIAVDGQAGVLYAASSSGRDVYSWSLSGGSLGSRRIVQSVPGGLGAKGLGALAFDSVGQQLFTVDPQRGKVYVVALVGRGVREFLSTDPPISAIAVDELGRKLYVGGGNRILSVLIDSPSQSKPLHAGFSNISGLIVASDHDLWVSDNALNKVEKVIPWQ